MEIVYATSHVLDTVNGAQVRIPKGSHWPADDPVVLRHRGDGLFSSDPRWGMLYSVEPDGYDAPIETATAVPGEKRSARRG